MVASNRILGCSYDPAVIFYLRTFHMDLTGCRAGMFAREFWGRLMCYSGFHPFFIDPRYLG